MNSLANLNAVVDVQSDTSHWPSDQGWDPPVATICTGSNLTDNRLHFHHSATPRQEWDWSDSHMLLASQYAADEHENLDCKPSLLRVETLGSTGGSGSGSGLGQYNAGILSAANLSPTIGGGVAQSSWPGLLNAVPLRQHIGLDSSTGSCYSSPSLMFGGEATGLGSGGSGVGLSNYYTQHSPLLGLASEMDQQRRIHDILKRGMYSASAEVGPPDFMSGRLGLNLGGRTYFSANDNNIMARFHSTGKRFRPNSPNLHVPLCQAEGCKADLSIAKHYHRRHKVCEYHSKAATVIITGNTQRFCQQCSRFHALTEFDEGKRSCRKRLADHNRRRRKPQPAPSALPPPNSGPPSNLQLTSSIENPAAASNLNEDQDVKAGAARSQSNQQGAQEQEATEGTAASTSSGELIAKPSLLSTMSSAPSVSLTLQNGSRENQSNPSSMRVSAEVNKINDKDSAYENQAAPFLLNGPSLSLSSNIATAPGAHILGDSVATSNHSSPVHASHSFNDVVPWLRAPAGPSSRINLMQKNLGKLSTSMRQDREKSMVYNTDSTSCTRNGNDQQFIDKHGCMFAEHMHNLQPQAGSVDPHRHNHQTRKTENWMLENAVAQEGQIALSLLETSSNKKDHNYNNHQSAFNVHDQVHDRHPLDFLHHQPQHHGAAGGLQLNSASPSDIDHEASDAALSLHCMQVLRPLNDSLYTTADFMKDGFV